VSPPGAFWPRAPTYVLGFLVMTAYMLVDCSTALPKQGVDDRQCLAVGTSEASATSPRAEIWVCDVSLS
jgi:hypothetical protein